jgi:hypothetical protein
MNLSKAAIGLYVALVFLSGIVVGALGYRLYTVSPVSASGPRSPEEYREKYLAEMRSRVKVSPEQEKQLIAILEETRARYKETRDSIEPQMQQIRQEQVDRVNAILTPEQRAEYARMRAERDRQRQQWEKQKHR